MLAIARRNAIKEQLQERKSVTITDLAARLNVTKETIRRDLSLSEDTVLLPFSAEKGTGRDQLVGLIEAAAAGKSIQEA